MKERQDATGAGAPRIIKKYPNRRLYDTRASSYITLADIKQLVMAGEPIVVRDAKTQEDRTRSILLQILMEEEVGAHPLFSCTALTSLIRFYGHSMQEFMVGYLDKDIRMLQEMQRKLMEQPREVTPEMWAELEAARSTQGEDRSPEAVRGLTMQS